MLLDSPSRQHKRSLESKELPWSGGAASKELRKFYLGGSEKRVLDSTETRPDNEDDARRQEENSIGKRTNPIEVSRSEATRRDSSRRRAARSTLVSTKNTPPSNKRRRRRGSWPTTTRGGEVRIPLQIWLIGVARNAASLIAGGMIRVSALLVLEYHSWTPASRRGPGRGTTTRVGRK